MLTCPLGHPFFVFILLFKFSCQGPFQRKSLSLGLPECLHAAAKIVGGYPQVEVPQTTIHRIKAMWHMVPSSMGKPLNSNFHITIIPDQGRSTTTQAAREIQVNQTNIHLSVPPQPILTKSPYPLQLSGRMKSRKSFYLQPR